MKIEKTRLPVVEVASKYFELAESILQAMIDCTLQKNLPAVFVLNRPFFHACYKGMWICLAVTPSDMPDDLLQLGKGIDAAIDGRFESWNAPFINKGVGRYAAFLESRIQGDLSDEGKLKATKLIERLHNDVHGGLPSMEFYSRLAQHGDVLHAAKELCIVGHDPLYLNFRFAMYKRFPDGPVHGDNLLAEPFGRDILEIHKLS
jgi:hypothetical protein